MAQHGRPNQDAGHDFTDHSRLAQALKKVATKMSGGQDQQQD
jgi:ABC-type branched-subunit amino acid transport system ATPase component